MKFCGINHDLKRQVSTYGGAPFVRQAVLCIAALGERPQLTARSSADEAYRAVKRVKVIG